MYPRVNFEERTLEGPAVSIVDLARELMENIAAFFGGNSTSFFEMVMWWWSIYSVIAIILSFLFFLGFVYAKIRYAELSEIEQATLREAEAKWQQREGGGEEVQNNKWSEIVKKSSEDNPNSWRLAIIEADILLEETLTNAGYVGATIGEKLKSANQTSFTTLQDAWEAHKVRNEIAHAGSDFVLTQRIAQDTIIRFERVFREFKVI